MTQNESLPVYTPRRKGTKFISYYSRTTEPTEYLTVEHRTEAPAIKGSWQSPGMRAEWIYRGYRAV